MRAVPVLVAVTCGLALFIAGLFGTSWGIDATKEAAANFNGQCPLGFLSPGCKTLYERQMQARTNAAIFGATLGLGVAVTLFGGLLEYRPRSVWGRDSYWLAAALCFIAAGLIVFLQSSGLYATGVCPTRPPGDLYCSAPLTQVLASDLWPFPIAGFTTGIGGMFGFFAFARPLSSVDVERVLPPSLPPPRGPRPPP